MRWTTGLLLAGLFFGCSGGQPVTSTVHVMPVDESSEVFNAAVEKIEAEHKPLIVDPEDGSLMAGDSDKLHHVFGPSAEALLSAVAGAEVPEDHHFAALCDPKPHDPQRACELLYLDDSHDLVVHKGATVKKQRDNTGGNVLVLQLSKEDGDAFEALTADYVGHRVAIVVDDRVLAAPIVREAIPGGQLWLTPGAHNPEHVDTLLAELIRAR